MTLKKTRPQRKRKAIKHREERFQATGPDQAWSIDFIADQLQDGRRFRALTVVDIFTREGLAIEVGQSLKGDDVVRTCCFAITGASSAARPWICGLIRME
jgi:putative transposase